jgi:hypothetical protein
MLLLAKTTDRVYASKISLLLPQASFLHYKSCMHWMDLLFVHSNNFGSIMSIHMFLSRLCVFTLMAE